jgi:hypothetical protein
MERRGTGESSVGFEPMAKTRACSSAGFADATLSVGEASEGAVDAPSE